MMENDALTQPVAAAEPAPQDSSTDLTGGKLLARNTLLNFVGQIIPFLFGVLTIPYVVHGIGPERFGVLSLAWVILGYFSLFDLGLGRATTKFIAESLGRNELDGLPGLVWTSVGFQLGIGAAGSVLVAAFVPTLVDRVLKVSPQFLHETKVSFLILAASLPVVLGSAALRSVLESSQRFDLINYIRVPANISVFVLPAIAVACGLQLPGIITLLVLGRVVAMIAHFVLCLKVYPSLARNIHFDRLMVRPLLGYGGWVTVSSVVSAFFASGDRFVIGALSSMAAVGYYTAPSEMVSRLSIFPGSLVLTLFPAFSSLEAQGAKERLERLYSRSVKFLLLILGPIVVLLAVLARDILGLWLGADFSAKSTLVLQILSIGILLNCLAYLPLALIQGVGRPDVAARFHLFELPLYIVLLWFGVTRMGIPGAALAWTVRVGCDALLLFGGVVWLKIASLRSLTDHGILRGAGAVVLLAIFLTLPMRYGLGLWSKVILSAAMLLPFAAASWRFVLDNSDRAFLAGSFGRALAAIGVGQ